MNSYYVHHPSAAITAVVSDYVDYCDYDYVGKKAVSVALRCMFNCRIIVALSHSVSHDHVIHDFATLTFDLCGHTNHPLCVCVLSLIHI